MQLSGIRVFNKPAAFDNASRAENSERLKKRSEDSAGMLTHWEKSAAIIGGIESVKKQASIFLPKFPQEAVKNYDFRVSVSKLTNIYHDNLETLASKPFEQEITLPPGENKELPEEIEEFKEDVDGKGNNLTVFSSETFFNAINSTHDWILVDYPKVAPGSIRSRADQKAANIRPFWSHVLAENVFEVRTIVVNGNERLSYIRIHEPAANGVKERFTEYTQEKITDAPTQNVWELADDGLFNLIEENQLTIDEIPMVPIICARRDGDRWFFKPALRDALELQITLFRQESNLEFAKTMTAFPMLSASGVKPEKDASGKPLPLTIGPQTILYAPADGAGNVGSWSYVEPSASSLTFLQSDIEKTKNDLRELGKQPLTAQSGNLTVITTAYAAGKSKTAVAAWGLKLKDGLENALVLTCKWFNIAKETYDPEVTVYEGYDDFSDEQADSATLTSARANGDLSRETYWEELQRRGVLSAEFDPEQEAERLMKELPGDGEDDLPDPAKPGNNPPGKPQNPANPQKEENDNEDD